MSLQHRRPFPIPKDTTRINEYIRVPVIRVIDDEGRQLGVIPTREALEKAREKNLDLVEVSPNADPPVCRITDYGKFKYEVSKKQKASKAKQHVIKVKEIKFHPKTGENDYNYRLVQAKEFLEKGFKVKATVVFRGREMVHLDYGSRWLVKMAKDLEGVGVAESGSQVEGRNVTSVFNPVKQAATKVKKADEPGAKKAPEKAVSDKPAPEKAAAEKAPEKAPVGAVPAEKSA